MIVLEWQCVVISDSIIHKTRQRYNKPQSLTTKINLTDLSSEMKLRPPYIVQLSQVEPVTNGYQSSISLAKLSGELRY